MSLFDWAALAVVTFGAAVLQAASGFGFAIVAAPLFLLLVEPVRAIQLVIIVTAAFSIVVLPRLWRAIAPRLLLRLTGGSLLGLPLGLLAFRHSDPRLVRVAAGITVLAFAVVIAAMRRGARRGKPTTLVMTPGRDLAAGAVSGAATALVGMSGPPVLIYLMLAGAPPGTVRATLLAFFALSYTVTLAAHAATIGVAAPTWVGRRLPDPVRAGRWARWPAARRSPRRRRFCRSRHRPARGGWAIYSCRRGVPRRRPGAGD